VDCPERTSKVDRVACPWLIKRFIDPQSGILVCVEEKDLVEQANKKGDSLSTLEKSLDQPRTSDTVNFDVFPGNPLHIYLTVAKSM